MAATLTRARPEPAAPKRDFDGLLRQLSKQSVEKHYDAYADIDWDGLPIDPADPRFALPSWTHWPRPIGIGPKRRRSKPRSASTAPPP